MATLSEFYIPDDDALLREVARVLIRHGHLDHMLQLAIKRMLGISIDDPGYTTETRGMSKGLRDRVRGLIDTKYAEPAKRQVLNSLLDKAEQLSEHRHRLAHAVWMREPGQEPLLHDRGKDGHKAYKLPTVEDLVSVGEQINQVQKTLNRLTQDLLKAG